MNHKLVHQPFVVVTFEKDLNLDHTRDCFKGLINKKNSEKGLHQSFIYGVS